MGDGHRVRSLSSGAPGTWRLPAVALALLVAVVPAARARVLVTPEEAVREAFAGAPAEKRTDYLDDAQSAAIAKLAGSPPSSRIVISYRASKEGRSLGTAYFETHLIRTLPESILVVLDPEGRVGKVEILSFDEPDQYLPKKRWMDQFVGRKLDSELSLAKGIRGVTGATLSSRAITQGVRRILATHQVLNASPRPAAGPPAPGSVPRPARTPSPRASSKPDPPPAPASTEGRP